MLLSVIVPIYKVKQYIASFIESIVNQLDKDFELILVDDCGGDGSVEKAIALLDANAWNYQVVYRQQNGGLSAARNSGLEKATGEFVYFADSDDHLILDAIASIKKALRLFPEQSLFLFNAYRYLQQNDYFPLAKYDFKDEYQLLNAATALEWLYGGKLGAYIWQYVFRKSIFDNVRFQEGAVWEDAILMPEVLSKVKKIVIAPHTFIYKYWVRQGSISQSVHPMIGAVIPALVAVGERLYADKTSVLYGEFAQYAVGMCMTLSRESFVRTNDFKRLMEIHHTWSASMPKHYVSILRKNGKPRSAYFLQLMRYCPQMLYLLYKMNILK